MFELVELQRRCLPSAAFAGEGKIRFDTGAEESAFDPSWTGGVNVVTDPQTGDVYAGAGVGGGPVFAHFDAAGGRVEPDQFKGPEWDRSGLIPILVGRPPAPTVVPGPTVYVPGPPPPPVVVRDTPEPFPHLTAGAGRLRVFLDLSGPWAAGLIDAGYVRSAVADLAAIYSAVDATVTTDYPTDLRPGEFLTVRVTAGRPPELLQRDGVAPETLERHTGFLAPAEVYALFSPDPDRLARVAGHEAAHALGLAHDETDPSNLMDPLGRGRRLDPGQLAEANAAVGRFAAGDRVGVYVETVGGASVYRYGPFRLLDFERPELGGTAAAG